MKNNVQKIVKIPFSVLWNSEYSLIFTRLIAIIGNYKVLEVDFENAYSYLK